MQNQTFYNKNKITSEKYTNDEIIKGLKNHDNKTINYIFKNFYNSIYKFILSNSGNAEDAKEIFHDAIITFYDYSKRENFNLTCSAQNFVFIIAKKIWFKKLRAKKHEQFTSIEKINDLAMDWEGDENEFNYQLKNRLIEKHFVKNLSEKCQKLLTLFSQHVAIKEITKIMGYKNDDMTYRHKYDCKERLIKHIKNDCLYSELY